MLLPSFASWCLTLAFACSGGWFVYQAISGAGDLTAKVSPLLHAVMCLVMIPMAWPEGLPPASVPQVALLGTATIWFAVSAARARRFKVAISNIHHALMAALMVWMVVMPMPMPMPMPAGAEMPGMQTDGHAMEMDPGTTPTGGIAPGLAALAAYCLVVTVVLLVRAGRTVRTSRSVRHLPSAAGHAAMSFGAGVLILAMA
ncbi:DUF5134 domain-containing protein [Kribbella sp. NPDC000426]|uniref:DUF5134 domain-containing protein n=1 Tax=Kribbella sp. NPDC000426 TaxID=3154255 RepID=UPI0033320642